MFVQGPRTESGETTGLITKRTITNLDGSSPYLTRWSLYLPFGVSLKLHKIMRADDDRCHHDHPWWFIRIILAGGYVEEHGKDFKVSHRKPWRPWAPWRLYYCGAEFRHRIISLPKNVNWTLVVSGSRKREWGFYTKRGWVQWREFVNEVLTTRVLWCEEKPE